MESGWVCNGVCTVTITGFLILASGFLLITAVVIPEVVRRVRVGTFYSRTPIFYGWLVLFTGALGAFAAISVAGAVLGGLQALISDEMGWTRTSIGFSASSGVWLSGVLAPFIGLLADRYGPRWLMPMGTVFLGLCLVALGGVNAIWQFFLIVVLVRAIGQPLFIGLVPRTVAVNFFQRRRNLALAFTAVTRPIASAINIQVILAIAASRGWRAGYRYLGFATLVLTIPMFLVVRRRPEDIGLLPYGVSAEDTVRGGGRSGANLSTARPQQPRGLGPVASDWTAREAMRTRAFWLVAIASFLVLVAAAGIGFNMVPYFSENAGLSTVQAAGVLSVSTFLSLANLGWGHLADRFTPRRCILWGLVGALGSLFYLFTVDNLVSAWVFGIVWGVFSSASDALVAMLMAQYFGRNSYGSIMGALRPFEAAGLGLGQTLGAIIYDVFGSYWLLIVISAASYMAAVILIFFTRSPTPRHLIPSPASTEVELVP